MHVKLAIALAITAILALAATAVAFPETIMIKHIDTNIINTKTGNHMVHPQIGDKNTPEAIAGRKTTQSTHEQNRSQSAAAKGMDTNAMKQIGQIKQKIESIKGRKTRTRPTVRYKPSPDIVIPIPEQMAKAIEHRGSYEHNAMREEEKNMMHREINAPELHIKTMCEHGQCYLIMDKNVNPKMVNAILEKTVPVNAHAKARVHAEIIRKKDFAVVKAVVEENTQTHVEYATADQGIFAVTVDIPKSEVNNPALIEGNVIFLKTDPVLRIYLRSENNKIAVAGFTIKKSIELNTTDALEFAACTLGIRNVQRDGSEITFQVTDGNQAVYVPSVKIEASGSLVLPQYDAGSKTYSAKLQNVKNARIVAYVQGCGEIIYPIATKAGKSSGESGSIAAILVILGIIAVAALVISKA